MNTRLRRIVRTGRHQARNLGALLSGHPQNQVTLGSTSLESDDVALARDLLHDRSHWQEPSVVSDFEILFARWNGSRHALIFTGGRVARDAESVVEMCRERGLKSIEDCAQAAGAELHGRKVGLDPRTATTQCRGYDPFACGFVQLCCMKQRE